MRPAEVMPLAGVTPTAAAASAAAPSSAPLANRSAGSFASARAMTGSNAACPGTAGGGSDRWAQSLRSALSSGNGTAPVSV